MKLFLVWFWHILQQLYKQTDSSSRSRFLSASFLTAGCERRSRHRIRRAGPAVSTSVAGRDFGLHLSAFGPPSGRHHVRTLVLSLPLFAPAHLKRNRPPGTTQPSPFPTCLSPAAVISPELVTLIDVRNCRYDDMSPRIKRQ